MHMCYPLPKLTLILPLTQPLTLTLTHVTIGMISSGFLLGTMLSLSGGSWEKGEEVAKQKKTASRVTDKAQRSGVTILPPYPSSVATSGERNDGDLSRADFKECEEESKECDYGEMEGALEFLQESNDGDDDDDDDDDGSSDSDDASVLTTQSARSDNADDVSVLDWFGSDVHRRRSLTRSRSSLGGSLNAPFTEKDPVQISHVRHIGNPFKDVTGPSINTLFKASCYVSVVFAKPIGTGNEQHWWTSLLLLAAVGIFLWLWKRCEPRAMSHIFLDPYEHVHQVRREV